jgi:2,4-dienoyl-CoA reductase-like NADH-dependent reductase (Old Yellow Enzyme family)
MTAATQRGIASLRVDLVRAHRDAFGSNSDADLFVGLQLTHSGRFSRPNIWDVPEPLAACRHAQLDRRFPQGVTPIGDDELKRLVDQFAASARMAFDAGFQFVDFKHCHGYLAHELLGARNRPGPYGGAADPRFLFARQTIEAIRAAAPGMKIGVRLSVFDGPVYRRGEGRLALREPASSNDELPGFGVLGDDDNLEAALEDARAFIAVLRELGVRWICVTAGSPYYCAHLQRPAFFPPADGYAPPEDPLHGVARQIRATASLKAAFPDVVFVGSAYSYLQEWLPHVAEYTVQRGWADAIGLGRMALAYPTLPRDVLEGRPTRRASICRTFSDCTTGPRIGKVSGCFPLDAFYKQRPEAPGIQEIRTAMSVAAGEETLS